MSQLMNLHLKRKESYTLNVEIKYKYWIKKMQTGGRAEIFHLTKKACFLPPMCRRNHCRDPKSLWKKYTLVSICHKKAKKKNKQCKKKVCNLFINTTTCHLLALGWYIFVSRFRRAFKWGETGGGGLISKWAHSGKRISTSKHATAVLIKIYFARICFQQTFPQLYF